MKLSIITINYNNAEGLRRTLASVAAQTYRNIEHIIIDGGSTDGSVDVIKEYDKQNTLLSGRDGVGSLTIHWLSEPDNGIYNAMNHGLEIALGRRAVNEDHTSYIIHNTSGSLCDYIQILNSGDILAAPDVTERMINSFHSFTRSTLSDKIDLPILYGNMLRDYGNGKFQRDTTKASGEASEVEWTMYDFIKGTVNHDPTYIHRNLYEKYGLYDESLKICSDWKWFVNAVVFGGEKLYYVPIDVTIFDTSGISEKNLEFREKERHAELEKMLPAAILKDYDTWHFPIDQVKRLKKHHLWGLVYFIERVLFKLEKWHIIKNN